MSPSDPLDSTNHDDKQDEEIVLVPLTAAFAEVASALHAQGFEDCWDGNAIIRMLDVPGAFGVLAFQPGNVALNGQDQPLGFVLIQAVIDEAEINTITVAPAARRLGVGKKLLAAVEERLRNNDVKRMLLEVAVDNDPAIGLYRQNGFAEVGRRKGYYSRNDGRKTDALVLERIL
ncbi:MAG: ribosomal protein S18-alanine N-acetyltransferase [Rhodospirillales bacterium]|nr:ribosomal protein S18-alanine N-acetyltransferase [Rhodospirillales bacterium]